jgi:hypothetical protein
MKYSFRMLLGHCLCLGCLIGLPLLATAQFGETTAADRRQFQEIASKLDLGGDLMLVLNTDAVVDRFMDAAVAADVGTPADEPHEKEIRETIRRFHKFLTRNGASAVHGLGLSMVPRDDGLHAVKCFISRDYADSNLPLWRGLVGWHPRRLLSLDFLPAGTVMARSGTPGPSALWQIVRSAVDEVAPEPSRKRFNEWHEATKTTLGIDVEELIDSLRDEALFAVRFSDTAQSVIPTQGGLVTIPAPTFLIIVGTDNDMLRGVVEAQCAKHKITLNESKVGDIIMRAAETRLPSLIPMQPAYASQSGFFLFGSSPEIVADALLAYRHKNGLLTRPEFKDAFQGLSMVNNGIVYISPEMGQVMSHVRSSNVDRVLAGTSQHPATSRMLKQLLTYGGQGQSCALVIQNWKNGVMVMGNSAWGGKDVLTRLAAAPVRLLTGMFGAAPHKTRPTPFSLFKPAPETDPLPATPAE